MNATRWPVTQMMSLGFSGQNLGPCVRRRHSKRLTKSLNPLLRLLLLMFSLSGRLETFFPHNTREHHNGSSFLFVPPQLQEGLSDPALPAEKLPTSVVTAPTPTAHSSLIPQQRNEVLSTADDNDIYADSNFEDEYSINRFDYDQTRFTDNFYEYEQGQKDIIVKNRLRDHIQFWKDIGANQYILDCIYNGYKIPFYSLPDKSFSKNNRSALNEHEFVSEAINSLLDRGLIVQCESSPSVVNPLTVSVQNNGKKRLILDLRKVNLHVWKQSVKFEDLRLALMYLEKGCWMIKFDIHSAYHFVDIFLPHTEYLGFAWNQGNGLVYYKFLVLPFGLSSACYIYTKLMRPLIAKWRGEGKKIIMFLDDGFGCGNSLSYTKRMSVEIKSDLLKSGLVPKADKSCWEPVQCLQWLGAMLNSCEFTVSIPENRILKAFDTLSFLQAQKYVPVRKVASFIGQIISMSVVLGSVSQIMTRCLSIDVLKAKSWSSYIQLSDDSVLQLLFWKENLVSLNVRKLATSSVCSRIVYTDASNSGFAGYEVQTFKGIIHDTWQPSEAAKSSTWRELCAVYRVLLSLVDTLSNQRVKWFSDNTGVCSIVSKGSMKPDLQSLAMSIFRFCSSKSIHLEVEWLPRDENSLADYFSKIIEQDDWGISFSVMDMLQARWGALDVDFFASEHNAKLARFYSRFWSSKTSGVDAFTFDWGGVFGLFVPPIILIPRVLCKLKTCFARGILIVPEWKSACFWPMLCLDNGLFKPFIYDWMFLPKNKESYTPCKNGQGMFGVSDLNFNMYALLVNFS